MLSFKFYAFCWNIASDIKLSFFLALKSTFCNGRSTEADCQLGCPTQHETLNYEKGFERRCWRKRSARMLMEQIKGATLWPVVSWKWCHTCNPVLNPLYQDIPNVLHEHRVMLPPIGLLKNCWLQCVLDVWCSHKRWHISISDQGNV
jgi:hypothetical protein